MDVRAPLEFHEGAFPCSVNVPILEDVQRHLIGTEYAANGQDAAIALGHRLATSDVRQQRVLAWQQFAAENPTGYLYCFRGGLRSRITQQWLHDVGCEYPLVDGGYKALRRFLLDQLERLCDTSQLLLVSGATGVGKTKLITQESAAIDLEGRAKHRGSAFGGTFQAQPAQIDWENQIIIDWMRCEAQGRSSVLIEAESHLIGRIHLPSALQAAMRRAPVVLLEASMEERIQRLYNDYIVNTLDHLRATSNEPWGELQHLIQQSLDKIRKRLGGMRWQQLTTQLVNAITVLRDQQDDTEFRSMIKLLLEHYYDPLYEYHQARNRSRVVCRGSEQDVQQWLRQLS